jgi:hypothetical protein
MLPRLETGGIVVIHDMRRTLTPLTLALVLGALPGLRALCLDTCMVTPSPVGQVASDTDEPASCHDDAPDSALPAAPTSDDCRHGESRSAPVLRTAAKTTQHHLAVDAHTVPLGDSFGYTVTSWNVLDPAPDTWPVTPSRFVSPLRL